jgi:hypothetical protein
MSLDADPSLWKQLTGWLWAVLLPFLYGVWKKADTALSKTEFAEYKATMRDDIKDIFQKVEENKDHANARMDQVRDGIEKKIDTMRTEMNGGFNAIREEIRQLRK